MASWIEFTLTNVAAGTYDVKMLYKSNYNRGVVQAILDRVNQGAPCNQYAATAAQQVACSLGSKTLTSVNHALRFTVTGKSASSAGYTRSWPTRWISRCSRSRSTEPRITSATTHPVVV